ncbi:MAG: hypothetical protein KME27_24550 [Lyngbya sp. HA4199-MV5]|jgi:hypothetical protein|nr:hypothetical protein [Lyngbya sp. HA4199-MV5]
MNHWRFLLKKTEFYKIDEHLVSLSEQYSQEACYLDYCFSALGCDCRELHWQALRDLVQECGWWIMPFEKLCIVCDRPRVLRFDSENRLHAKGEPAIQFADGYSLYFYRDVALPEKYGKVHPHLWRAKWILKEQNAELRRVLIQGIGYTRICQELQAVALDSWREYTLLKIEAEADVEPIVLLKMTCPSTHHIHALRVPPAMTSAREADRWVNHGIDSEAFAIET